jgi:hypothetical protein
MDETENIESEATSESHPISADDSAFATIAAKVRADSNLARLTHVEELESLFAGKTPEQIIHLVAELIKTEQYQDIKVLISASGAGYLYSASFIAPAEAGEKALMEEVQETVANKVRADSAESARLTPMKDLPELFPDAPPEQIEKFAGMMAGADKYQDIESVIGPGGAGYLYCATHMTENYAKLLARVETKNPFAAIAETVREESRIYPRPTKVALFYEPVFQIDANLMQIAVEGISQRVEYKDIKKIVAPNGAIYLFSDLYLSEPQAQAFVQWEEVDKLNNP